MSELARPRQPDPYEMLPPVDAFTVVSDDLTEGGTVPDSAVEAKGNTSPQLSWSGFPEQTKSFAITVFDPDAPTPSGFWHWAVANLPASVTSLPAGAGSAGVDLPAGACTLRNEHGEPAFAGAAPPPGDVEHRYYFVVHAVDVERLELTPDQSPTVLSFMLSSHTLARAVLVATYAEPAG